MFPEKRTSWFEAGAERRASSLQTIRRVSLRDVTVERIRQAIERGELRAGEQITELGLARKLGVAQPTIREALLELEFIGFIERLGPRRTCVTMLSRQKIDEIYVVRARLEALAVELVASHRADLSVCDQCFNAMMQFAKSVETSRFYQADLEFHRALWRATRNESLADALERLVPKLFAFGIIRQARPKVRKLMEIAGLHGRLLELIRSGDVKEAKKLMDLSMEKAWLDDAELP